MKMMGNWWFKTSKKWWEHSGNDEKCWYSVAILPCTCTKMTAFPMAPVAPSLGPLIPSWLEQAGTLMAIDGPADTELKKHNSERHRGTGHPPWNARAMKHCQVFCAEKLWLPQFVAPTASTCSGRKMETTSLLSSQLPPFTSQQKIWKIYFFRQIPPTNLDFSFMWLKPCHKFLPAISKISWEWFLHTLWWTYKKLLKMAIEIVDFASYKWWIFPWQNVSSPEGIPPTKKLWFSWGKIMALMTFPGLQQLNQARGLSAAFHTSRSSFLGHNDGKPLRLPCKY